MYDSNTTRPQVQIRDFVVVLKNIDEAINTDSAVLISKVHILDSSLAMIGNDQLVGINGDIYESLGSQARFLEKVEPQLTSQTSILPPREFMFEMGLVDKQLDSRVGKDGPKKGGGKGKNKQKPSNGPADGFEGPNKETNKSPTRGSWTRLWSGSLNQDGMDCLEVERDPKRKHDETTTILSEDTCMGKKQRLEEETKSLSIIMASQLGSAEVTEQLR